MEERIWNPYLPEYEYIPDGEPHVFGERVYIYGSHDRFGGNRFCLNDYVCYSAGVKDLKHWRYEGVIYKKIQDSRMNDGKHELWAPDVVQGKDGRYYLYYCPDDKIKSIGVAVCDTPAGKYQFLGIVQDKSGNPIGERPGDTIQFDPGVFIDEDGTIYLYSGNGPRTRGAIGREPKASVVMTMEDDMITIRTEPKKMLPTLGESEGTGFEGHEFFEASSIRKIRGRYYLVYSSVHLHELCYAVSSRPDGGFVYGGVLVSNCDVYAGNPDCKPLNNIGNNHGGIECVDGEYYIFYHRQTNRSMFSRQGCAEKLTLTEDGKFLQAQITSEGLNGAALPENHTYPASCVCVLYGKKPATMSHPLAMGGRYPYLTQDGEDFDPREKRVPPRQYITNVKRGMTAVFRYFQIKKTGQITVTVRGKAKGILKILYAPRQSEEEIRKGIRPETTLAGEIEMIPYQEWTTCSAKVQIPAGEQAIYFYYEGRGKLDILEFTLGLT